jgi:hypothetical protein
MFVWAYPPAKSNEIEIDKDFERIIRELTDHTVKHVATACESYDRN